MKARPLGSLRSRVFAATALVAVLTTALALGLATRRVTQEAEEGLARSLAEAARLVAQYHGARRARVGRARPGQEALSS